MKRKLLSSGRLLSGHKARRPGPTELLLVKASQVQDLFGTLPTDCATHERDGVRYVAEALHAADASAPLMDWCLGLCRRNMQTMYEQVWGWSDARKRRQLASRHSRLLVAYDVANKAEPVGFTCFRFEKDEGVAVLYCYELQLAPEAQHRGLGAWLVKLLELVAWQQGMAKAMLTVFTANSAAMAFYTKMRYTLDETSPDEGSYRILSKPAPPPQQQQQPAGAEATAAPTHASASCPSAAAAEDTPEAPAGRPEDETLSTSGRGSKRR